MKKVLTLILFFMCMLSLNAQNEVKKDTVYVNFNPHIARLDNQIADYHSLGLDVSNVELIPVDGGFEYTGYSLVLTYICDDLYIPLTPDMKYGSESSLIDMNTFEMIDISNVNGEVKEVDGKTVFDFSLDGSNGKVYVIHAEAYIPEIKEEVDMSFKDVTFHDYGRYFSMYGTCGNYSLQLQCYLDGKSYDGTYNCHNNMGAVNSVLICESPRGMLTMLELEYTVTTREDSYLDVHGQYLLENGTLVHFYMTNAPEGESAAIQNVDENSENLEAIYDFAGNEHNSLQKGVNVIRLTDGSVRKIFVK